MKHLLMTPKTKGKPFRFKSEQGRNTECECGSKKKYKNCCLIKLNKQLQLKVIQTHKK